MSQLSKSGMLSVTLWDSDSVESHNIPNQAFGINMVGRNKAEAMAEIVQRDTGLQYKHRGNWSKDNFGGEALGSVVFSCVDSMKVRKEILDSMKQGLFIEVRMGVYHGQVFSIDTSIEEDRKFWHDHYVGDDIIEEKSACGTSLTIGSTANLLSSIASWQVIKYMNDEKLARCLTACVSPYTIMET